MRDRPALHVDLEERVQRALEVDDVARVLEGDVRVAVDQASDEAVDVVRAAEQRPLACCVDRAARHETTAELS